MITVLMPVYNGGEYLRSAIESILSQTYTDFEFIIIDDGSTDNTKEIIDSYDDKRIRNFNNTTNQGLIFSLNKGIDNAKGRYIARMDSDDISLPQRFEKQIEYLDKNPDIVVLGSLGYNIDENGSVKNIIKLPEKPGQILTELLFGNVFIHTSIIAKTEVIRQYRYNKEYVHAEDYYLWSQIAKEHKIANLQQPLVRYRVHENCVSLLKNKEQSECVKRIQLYNLSNLGIAELMPAEEHLHLKLISYRFRPETITFEEIGLANKWIRNLFNQNHRFKVYEKTYFKEKLESVWATCFSYDITFRFGLRAVTLIFSSLSREASVKAKLRFFFRCVQVTLNAKR